MKKRLTLSFLLVFSSIGFADVELLWRRLDTQYTYKDVNTQCSTKTSVGNSHIPGEAYLALELEDDKVIGGRISNHPNIWPFQWIYKAIDLEPREVSSFEIVRDKKKQAWVKKFMLTERLAKWLIHFPTTDHFWCPIPFLPRTLSPSSQQTTFETEGIDIGVEVSYSDWMKVNGERPDGVSFEETIRFVQRKADN